MSKKPASKKVPLKEKSPRKGRIPFPDSSESEDGDDDSDEEPAPQKKQKVTPPGAKAPAPVSAREPASVKGSSTSSTSSSSSSHVPGAVASTVSLRGRRADMSRCVRATAFGDVADADLLSGVIFGAVDGFMSREPEVASYMLGAIEQAFPRLGQGRSGGPDEDFFGSMMTPGESQDDMLMQIMSNQNALLAGIKLLAVM